jgi:hypothetical protein
MATARASASASKPRAATVPAGRSIRSRRGGTVVNQIARTRTRASRLVLPVVANVNPPGPPPSCPGLRGQPCRSYVPASNGG